MSKHCPSPTAACTTWRCVLANPVLILTLFSECSVRTQGWMHHLARHSVACFLTRGDLYQSWEGGKAVFEELLIDQDHFLNAANW